MQHVTQAGFLETYDMNSSAGDDINGRSRGTLDIGVTGADSKSTKTFKI